MRKINLSRWALENQPLVRYLLAVFVFAGVAAFFSLGQEEDPPFVFRGMVVRAYWPGATAMQMGQQVADPIEKVIQEIPYAYKIRSYSKPGETVIFLQLDDSAPPKQVADIWYTTRKRVSDMAGTLPRGVAGPFFNDEFGDTFGVLLAFSADGFKYAELKDFVIQVRQEMLKVPDVAKVQLFGVQPEKVFIDISHYKIAQLGVSAQDIFNQINSQNAVTSQGVLSLENQKVWSRVQGQFESIEDIANTPIRAGKNTLLLKDIAHVHRGYQDPPVSKMRFNGKEVIGLGISMVNGGDIIRLGQELEKVERRILAELPIGIELQRVADQPKSVSTSVSEFVKVLIEAIVIVLAVSFLSLGLHSKRIEHRHEAGAVDALLGHKITDEFGLVELQTFGMHGVEHLGMQRGDQTQRFDRKVKPLVDPERILAEGDRDAAEGDIGRQLGGPGGEIGLEMVAVRAAVPEELDHFNLAGRRRHGGGLAQLHVVRAFDRPLRLGHARQCGAQSGQASHAKGVQRKLTTVHERDPFRVRRTHF